MNLKGKLSHLPADKINELENITSKILETGLPVMILLYGSYARGDWTEKAGTRNWFYNPAFQTGKKSDYDLLILVNDERDHKDLKDKLYKMFDYAPTAVQAIVESIGFVNMQLKEGQYFYSEIKEQGIILFKDNYVKLSAADNITRERRIEIAKRDFKHWYKQAIINFEDCEIHRFKGKKDSIYLQTCAFDLQQSVEHCYTAIEVVFSRNNPREHRLSILRMNAERYVPEIDECFPIGDYDSKQLFDHLDAAYIGGRYISEDHYKVTEDQLNYWQAECEKLLEITKTACENRIDKMKY